MPLTVQSLRKIERREKPYKLFDGGGLFLQVPAVANKRAKPQWRFRYNRNYKENLLALGAYPQVTLAEESTARSSSKAQLSRLVSLSSVAPRWRASSASWLV